MFGFIDNATLSLASCLPVQGRLGEANRDYMRRFSHPIPRYLPSLKAQRSMVKHSPPTPNSSLFHFSSRSLSFTLSITGPVNVQVKFT
jgi:hypothetical protein